MARVQLEAALTGLAHIFPSGAPPPTMVGLTRQWQGLIGRADQRSAALVAYLDGPAGSDAPMVGTAVAQPDPVEPRRGHLRSVYVVPDWWGRGVGQRLHDVAVGDLRRAGFREASLWVLERNTRARAIYERLGWRPSPDRQTIWPDVHEVRYLLDLTPHG